MAERAENEGFRMLDDFVCDAIHEPGIPQGDPTKQGKNEGIRVVEELVIGGGSAADEDGKAKDPVPGETGILVDGRPRIVCLCGSTKFMDAFYVANRNETLKGHIVLSVGVDLKKRDKEVLDGKTQSEIAAIKDRLDCLHRRKIDLADEILVLNVGDEYGPSTRGEIEYAKKTGKLVRFLEPEQAKPS